MNVQPDPTRSSPVRRFRRAAGALLLAAAAAAVPAGCGGGRSTPETAFNSVRAAVATKDPHLYYEIHQNEIRALARQSVREWRARIERGEAARDVLAEAGGLTEAEVLQGTVEEAAGHVLVHYSPISARTRWYEGAEIAKTTLEGDDAALLRLRGTDGGESDLWMIREEGGWAIDSHRTWLRAK